MGQKMWLYLDDYNALYVGLPLRCWKLQLVWNAAARMLTGVGQKDHSIPVLTHLHWLPICVLAKFMVLIQTFKALYGMLSCLDVLLWMPPPPEIRQITI